MTNSFDVTKEDLGLKEFVVSNVNKFNSKSGKELISVTLVGLKKYTSLPGLLYFGEKSYDVLSQMTGQKVNVLLGASQQGFNIKELQAI